MKQYYPDIGLHVPTLLLPRSDIDLTKWAVIACDQHTSEPGYWRTTADQVVDSPSTLSLVYPEAFLTAEDRKQRIVDINGAMRTYLDEGILEEQAPGFMLVERDVGRDHKRRGLIVALDLTHYDYSDGAKKLIRTTEGTDPARLPPRVEVRRDAALEVSHIMVLIDDPNQTVIEPLFEAGFDETYSVDLMQGGGNVRGWHITTGIEDIAAKIADLAQGTPPMIYAMGDGNHSFATAQSVWDEIKTEVASDHPARYATVELVNLHDPSLVFEPIHRFVEGVNPVELISQMKQAGFTLDPGGQRFPWQTHNASGELFLHNPKMHLEIASLHEFLDQQGATVDYIHGADTIERLVKTREDSIGFLLPDLDKFELFESIRRDGATPRKTFSLGEAYEKRYYLECRKIR